MRLRGPSGPDVSSAPSAHHVARTGSGIRRPGPTSGAAAVSCGDRPARSTLPDLVGEPRADPPAVESGWVLLAGLGGPVLVMGAVVVEVVSSGYANSSVPGWAHWVSLAWPQPLRVAWWLAVATAAAGFRWSLGRLGLRTSRVVTVLTVCPFVALAFGVGAGADWATWH